MNYEQYPSEKHGAPPYPGPPMPTQSPYPAPQTPGQGAYPGPPMPAQDYNHPPQPPAPAYNTPRVLHIYRDGITSRHMTITDEAKNQPLYKIDQNSGGAFSSKPHMTIRSPSSGQAIGTATFHSWSRTIDLEFHGRPVPFESEGMFTRSYAFFSPAFGEKLRWECDGIWGADLVLVNQRKDWIAKFDASLFSMSKTGKLHVVNGAINGVALDEIVLIQAGTIDSKESRRAIVEEPGTVVFEALLEGRLGDVVGGEAFVPVCSFGAFGPVTAMGRVGEGDGSWGGDEDEIMAGSG
ncbi:MAG: hypothetical protein L6R41_004941 [Letrouitia leprolyta]|nr:MAG: hypothetical protein L6R41_004941 [Letrouitia leprolyta]